MSRYIDAEKLLKALNIFKDEEHGNEHFINGIKTAVSQIQWQPTADVEEVRHGKWIKEYTDGFGGGKRNYKMICPFCDYSYFDNHCGFIVPEHFNYCPNCGAKMDKEKEE